MAELACGCGGYTCEARGNNLAQGMEYHRHISDRRQGVSWLQVSSILGELAHFHRTLRHPCHHKVIRHTSFVHPGAACKVVINIDSHRKFALCLNWNFGITCVTLLFIYFFTVFSISSIVKKSTLDSGRMIQSLEQENQIYKLNCSSIIL